MVSHHFDVQLKNNNTGLIDVSQGFLDVLNSYWLQILVELWPYQNVGSNEPWDIGDLWQPVLYWYLLRYRNSRFGTI